MNDWNNSIIAEFRANGGAVKQFEGKPMVILNTIGAKTGKVRDIPLVALAEENQDMVVFASYAGAPNNPDWYYNLVANPKITVEFGSGSFEAEVVELPVEEAARKLDTQAALISNFGDYKGKAAPRLIPAFSIRPV